VNNLFSALIPLRMAERSEVKSAKRSFASKYLKFALFSLRYGQPFLAKLKRTANWSLYPQG
jgi:hypothetical protein